MSVEDYKHVILDVRGFTDVGVIVYTNETVQEIKFHLVFLNDPRDVEICIPSALALKDMHFRERCNDAATVHGWVKPWAATTFMLELYKSPTPPQELSA